MSEQSSIRTPPPPPGLFLIRGALRLLSHAAPDTASRVAADLFMKPRRFEAPERERSLMEGAHPFEVVTGDGRLQAWRWGEGPAVLLVHGWEGRGSQLAQLAQPLVSRGLSVVTFDAPGHGASDGSRSSLPQFLAALQAVAGATGGLHGIAAHSFGCAAATLALHEGLAARRVVYFAPPIDPSDYTGRFGETLGLTDAVVERMRLRIEKLFRRKWSDYSLAAMAPAMSARLLVIHDTTDRETYWSEGAALTEAWPGARMITTQGLGHRRILREPELLEKAASFLAEEPLI
ncbi:MAG TPA: alpha/beta hydrolase [Thermoanaerobaculia bacterium]